MSKDYQGDDFSNAYDEKAMHLIETLDFNKLAEIKNKELKGLTDEDMEFMGFNKQPHEEIKDLYGFEDLDHVKVYVNRLGDKFELRGYMLRKIKDINSITELFDETLTKWKLKM